MLFQKWTKRLFEWKSRPATCNAFFMRRKLRLAIRMFHARATITLATITLATIRLAAIRLAAIRPATISLACIIVSFLASSSLADEPLRAGIIGCDTSHVPAFTKLLNAERSDSDPMAGVRVTAAFPGGSEDIASSRDRVAGFTQQLRELDVEIVSSIDELLQRVDVVLLESVDSRKHLEQIRPVIEAGKPVFVDKPFAPTVAEAIEIFDLANQYNVPIFSSSSLRYSPEIATVNTDSSLGTVLGCDAYSPCLLEPTHQDLFWYGIHGVETLFTVMGPGCREVSRSQTSSTDVVTGIWEDGRIGRFRGTRSGKHAYGALVFGSESIEHRVGAGDYQRLVTEIVQFFKSGKSPVEASETLEILAFMEAAEQSAANGGATVSIEQVLAAARR
jgi:hypothetical protein